MIKSEDINSDIACSSLSGTNHHSSTDHLDHDVFLNETTCSGDDDTSNDSTFLSATGSSKDIYEDESINTSGSSTDIYEDEHFNPLTFTREGLSVLYTNADNLINKLDELRLRLSITNPDIVIITDSWLTI